MHVLLDAAAQPHREESVLAGEATQRRRRFRRRNRLLPEQQKERDGRHSKQDSSVRVSARDQEVLRKRPVAAADSADEVHHGRQQQDAPDQQEWRCER